MKYLMFKQAAVKYFDRSQN